MYNTKIQPSDSGPGTYRFLVGSAVLAVQESVADTKMFHRRMEYLIAVAQPILADRKEDWRELMDQALVDDEGRSIPDGEGLMPVSGRYMQLGFIMRALREAGIFGSRKQEVDTQTSGTFRHLLEERGQVEEA